MLSRYRLDSAKALDLTDRLPANPGQAAQPVRADLNNLTDS